MTLGNAIRIKEFLQTDAAITGLQRRSLIDLTGEVIGINTAIASHNGSNSGVAFSIPSNLVRRVDAVVATSARQPRLSGHAARANIRSKKTQLSLGMDRVQGLVEKVYLGTPAANAGLKQNDVILQVETIAIRNENHMINLIQQLESRATAFACKFGAIGRRRTLTPLLATGRRAQAAVSDG